MCVQLLDCWALLPHLAPLQPCSWHPSSPRLALSVVDSFLLLLSFISPSFSPSSSVTSSNCCVIALPCLPFPSRLRVLCLLSSSSALQHPSSWWPSPISLVSAHSLRPINRFLPSFCPRNIPSPSLCASLLSECDLGSDSVVPFHHRFLLFHASMQFSLPFPFHSVFTVNRASAYLLLQFLYPPSRFWLILSTFCFPSSPLPGRASTQMLILSFFLFSSSYLPVPRAQLFPSLSLFSLPNSCLLLPFFPSPSLCLPCQGAVSVYGTESTRLLRLLQPLPRNALPHFQLYRCVPFSMSALVASLQSHPSVHHSIRSIH